jgi:hypothetical protein
VYESVKPSTGTGKLLWHKLGAKTIELIHQNVHVDAIHDDLETLVLDAELLEAVLDASDPGWGSLGVRSCNTTSHISTFSESQHSTISLVGLQEYAQGKYVMQDLTPLPFEMSSWSLRSGAHSSG